MKTIAIIQCRMNSTRLPGKALLELGGEKIYRKVYNRVKQASKIAKVVMAFPESERREWEKQDLNAMEYYFGDDTNLLKRYYQGLQIYPGYDTLVRVTADCPYIDYEMINEFLVSVDKFGLMKETDLWIYGGNVQGFNFEVYNREHFEDCYSNSCYTKEELEHVTECFTMAIDKYTEYNYFYPRYTNPKIRITLDYPEDYEVMKYLMENKIHILLHTAESLQRLYDRKPEIFKINESRY